MLHDIKGDLQPRFTQGLLPLVALTLEHYTQYQQLDLKVQIVTFVLNFLLLINPLYYQLFTCTCTFIVFLKICRFILFCLNTAIITMFFILV